MNPEHIKAYLEYMPWLEVSPSSAAMNPNNCAVIERTADGESVGPCMFYLKDGATCPRHGVVKQRKQQCCERDHDYDGNCDRHPAC